MFIGSFSLPLVPFVPSYSGPGLQPLCELRGFAGSEGSYQIAKCRSCSFILPGPRASSWDVPIRARGCLSKSIVE
ncbi:hypothetical protein HanIR_Chr12g0589491 [Helianthus annuus]|nr:hypothetical protein HanIR_Chr12g0589491 [Helianthus annuus]